MESPAENTLVPSYVCQFLEQLKTKGLALRVEELEAQLLG